MAKSPGVLEDMILPVSLFAVTVLDALLLGLIAADHVPSEGLYGFSRNDVAGVTLLTVFAAGSLFGLKLFYDALKRTHR